MSALNDEILEYSMMEYEERRNDMSRRESRKRVEAMYFLKQKAVGAFMILVGFMPMVLESDATFAFFAFPLGVTLMVTKQKILMID